MPQRRALARANLARVCASLAASGSGSARARRAATDPRVLERMVRDVFGHWMRTYAESALAPHYSREDLAARVSLATPEITARALAHVATGAQTRGRIYVGFHHGAVELSGLYAVRLADLRVTGPMEQVANPGVRRYFDQTRGELGINLVPSEG